MTAATCGNCEAPLMGPYCAQCGQHAHDSARTLGVLLHDAWHVLTHVDGRFWSTLGTLLVRPGQLTLDYFAERRARYVQPFRLYLVLSVAFFLVLSLHQSGERAPAAAASRTAAALPSNQAAEVAEVTRDAARLADAARAAAAAAAAGAPGATPRVAPAAAPAAAPQDAASRDADRSPRRFVLDFDARDCAGVRSDLPWLEGPLRAACLRNAGDHGRTLRHAFLANIPKMMFVFLPLIAAVMLLLYWFPRRYYVEHLVFVLHNHAALFLAMTLDLLLDILGRYVPGLAPTATARGIGVAVYAAWYVYRAMRRYYGQRRALTLLKLAFVGLSYLVFLMITLVGTLAVSALTA